MKARLLPFSCLTLLLVTRSLAGPANQPISLLKVNGDAFSNVVVIASTATHVSFTHSRGMGSLKLRDLSPEWQKRLGFNRDQAAAVEAKQHEADTRFLRDTAAHAAGLSLSATNDPAVQDVPGPTEDAGGDTVLPTIYARSFRGERPPQIIVDQWITASPPTVEGKFVLVDFWATWVGPCQRTIPHLNALSTKFKDQLVVIGLTDEAVAEVEKMKSPGINYYVGTDPQARTRTAVEVRGLPHSLLMDPNGIVRYEGVPDYLTEQRLERLIEKYAK